MSISERVLGIQIQRFENMFNAEIRNDMYCCCDDPDTQCRGNIHDLGSTTCSNAVYMCHPYFLVYFQACPSVEKCYVAKTINVTGVDLTSVISSFLIQIPFNQSELETYNQVRIFNCILNKIIYIYI